MTMGDASRSYTAMATNNPDCSSNHAVRDTCCIEVADQRESVGGAVVAKSMSPLPTPATSLDLVAYSVREP